MKVARIINEPTAAAIAYGLDKQKELNILVFDLGGGTFDVSVLTIEDGVFEVLSTNGDTHLGGEDFDNRIIEHFVKLFKKKASKDASKDAKAMGKLKREAEKAKRALSSQMSVRVEIESFIDGEDFSETLTRAKFEELNMDLFKKTIRPVERALKDAKLDKSQIDEIVLVGGSTRIPKVVDMIENYFNGKKASKGVNPDEAVAIGAAIQGGVLAGDVTDILLLDVTPLSLGIETLGGVFTRLIPRNTTIPAKRSQTFSTAADGQTQVQISVYQGERELVKDNKLLGNFTLSGIPPAPRGIPQIEVSFDIDANGIVHVSAKDKATQKDQTLTIVSSGGLGKVEIERMVEEAERNAESDRNRRETIEAINGAESQIADIEKSLKEYSAQIPQEESQKINSLIGEARASLSSESITAAEINEKLASLRQASLQLFQMAYQKKMAETAPGNNPSTTDAEFKEEKK